MVLLSVAVFYLVTAEWPRPHKPNNGVERPNSMRALFQNRIVVLTVLFAFAPLLADQEQEGTILKIETADTPARILQGHLRMGTPGGPDGVNYGVNSLHFQRSGDPWLPVMGEIHYSRVPNAYWEDAILAMKAGGVDIISTYAFWIFHEEIQGRYTWDGDCDLRRFVELCAKHDVPVWLRIGPWCHGEARNGGFPDWLSHVCRPRTMDPAYMEQVERWYAAVNEQVQGLYHKDGGPIIGIQFDNEYGHVGGSGTPEYIPKLKEIALRLGMDVPYYSVTGWGGAWVPQDEVLPLQAAYVDWFWAEGTAPLPPFKELLFSDLISLVLDTTVASDRVSQRVRQEQWRYDPSRYPFAMAELGGGMHHKILRRPVLDPVDIEALALCRLGEGANLIGYYMYHGGSQPRGRTGWLVEGDMPLVSYDFQAPLGEFGKPHASYYLLKRLHQFIQDFGQDLALMLPSLPAEQPAADDLSVLRYALRRRGRRGFLFFNNHQRYLDMPDRKAVQFAVTFDDEELVFPEDPITIPSGCVGVFPINAPMADATLVYATAQPLMRWRDGEVTHWVMARLDGVDAHLCVEGIDEPKIPGAEIRAKGDAWSITLHDARRVSLRTDRGARIEITFLSERDSRDAWKVRLGDRRHLAVCPVELWQSGDALHFRSHESEPVALWFEPSFTGSLSSGGRTLSPSLDEGMFTFKMAAPSLPEIDVTAKPVDEIPAGDADYAFKPAGPVKAWQIELGAIDWTQVSDVRLRLAYVGDMARLYLNGALVADNFWCKPSWDVWLKRWQEELSRPGAELVLVVSPWKNGQQVFVQERPDVTEALTARLESVAAVAERAWTYEMRQE